MRLRGPPIALSDRSEDLLNLQVNAWILRTCSSRYLARELEDRQLHERRRVEVGGAPSPREHPVADRSPLGLSRSSPRRACLSNRFTAGVPAAGSDHPQAPISMLCHLPARLRAAAARLSALAHHVALVLLALGGAGIAGMFWRKNGCGSVNHAIAVGHGW